MTDNDAKNVDVLNMTIVCRLVVIGKNLSSFLSLRTTFMIHLLESKLRTH